MAGTTFVALLTFVLLRCSSTLADDDESEIEFMEVVVYAKNQTVELPCSARSNFSSFEWTKNGQPMYSSDSTLVITDLVHGDSGEYRCKACEDLECVNKTVQLDVTYNITGEYMRNKSLLLGAPATVRCVPKILIKYNCSVNFYKVDQPPISLSDVNNLTESSEGPLNSGFDWEVTEVKEDLVGFYTCVVTISNKSRQNATLAYKSVFLNVTDKVEETEEGKLLNEMQEQEESMSTLKIVGIVVGVLFFLVIMLSLLYRQSKLKQKYYDRWVKVVSVTTLRNTESDTFQMPIVSIQKLRSVVVVNSSYEPVSTMEYEFPIDEDWEFPREKLTLGKELGEGCFGKVLSAEAEGLLEEGSSTPVAIKMLKEEHTDNDVKDLICELEIMKIIGRHPNIVNLLGCCARDGPLYVIVEFAAHGNLKSFLPNHSLTQTQLVNFAHQIALGMQHLSSMKLIHRDLAARNVLVSEGYTMKIADFGLARDVHNQDYYRKTTAGKLPIRWMAPESLEKLFFDTKSDVWSFGVLLWEIMTLGKNPYSWINGWEFLLEFLRRGNRLEQPANCPNEIFDIMKECWQFEADERPNFELITKSIECFSLELELCNAKKE